jgi:solute carrier family 25 (mitochondrial carnitine/acylcarnitine transporter), member 20/29
MQALFGHPLDLIKVRMQSSPRTFPTLSAAVRKTFAEEGVVGFFKGLSAPLVMAGYTNAALFAFYNGSKRIVASSVGVPVSDLSLSQICLATWVAAPGYCLCLCPVDVVKNQLQFQSAGVQRLYSGPFDCARSLGVRGLLQGYLPTLGTRLLGSPAYFCSYEFFKGRLVASGAVEPGARLSLGLSAGFGAGICFWCANFPVDLIKTRVQINRAGVGTAGMSPLQVAKHILKHEGGVLGLYRGFLPCVLRAGPANAVAFGGFEMTMKVLGDGE